MFVTRTRELTALVAAALTVVLAPGLGGSPPSASASPTDGVAPTPDAPEGTPALGAPASACQSRPSDAVLAARISRTRALALTRLAAADSGRTDRFPYEAPVGATSWSRRGARAWTSGFYPGSLWQAYAWTRDPRWLVRARKWTAGMRGQAINTTTHDLGFMLDINAGRGASLDPSVSNRRSYARTTLTAARSLATRWDPQVGLLKAGVYGGEWGAIIDSAMNTELLFHGATLTSSANEADRLRRIAHRHLLTISRDFVRADGGTYHRLVYNAESGALIGAIDGQGFSRTSTWTRGQAWAVYGLTNGFRRTGDQRLLAAARATADRWLARISADCVPVWDFDAPDTLPFKDSSAGVIAAAGLFELARLEPDEARAASYRAVALAMTAAVTTPAYTTRGTSHPAILRRESYYIPAVPVEGSYSWGDYYLLEAMTRAKRELTLTLGRS